MIESGEYPKNDNWVSFTRSKQAADMHDRLRRPATQPLKHFVKFRVRYSIGKLRGFGPRGNALSSAAISFSLSVRFAAAALSAACSSLAAFGIANTEAWRVRKLRATWRGDAPCASAMACNNCPALLRGDGKSL